MGGGYIPITQICGGDQTFANHQSLLRARHWSLCQRRDASDVPPVASKTRSLSVRVALDASQRRVPISVCLCCHGAPPHKRQVYAVKYDLARELGGVSYRGVFTFEQFHVNISQRFYGGFGLLFWNQLLCYCGLHQLVVVRQVSNTMLCLTWVMHQTLECRESYCRYSFGKCFEKSQNSRIKTSGVPSSNMEKVGFMTYTAASQQGETKMIWLHFSLSCRPSLFTADELDP